MTTDTETVLYGYAKSSASYRLRIVLNLKEIPYQQQTVNLLEGDQRSPEHLARNPQELVPVLDIDGYRLTQSMAILEYLEEVYPTHPLLPKDTYFRAKARAAIMAIAMEIQPICNLRVLAQLELTAGGDSTVKIPWMKHFIKTGLAAFEELLTNIPQSPFCFGDRPTLVECVLMPQLFNARRWEVPLENFPQILKLEAACAAIPAFDQAHPNNQD